MEAQVEKTRKGKKYKITVYLDERYYNMLTNLKERFPQLSKNDLIRISILKMFHDSKKTREEESFREEASMI